MEIIRGTTNRPNRRKGMFKLETIAKIQDNQLGNQLGIIYEIEVYEGFLDGEFNDKGDFIIKKDCLEIQKQYFSTNCREEVKPKKSIWKKLFG